MFVGVPWIWYFKTVWVIGPDYTGENHRSVTSHWQTLSHNVVSSTPHHKQDSNAQHLVVIDTDCLGKFGCVRI
jgi:hypothetical protein